MPRHEMRRWTTGLLLACATWGSAQAGELKVLTAGAFKPVLLALAPEFQQRSGHTLKLDNDTAGALLKRIQAGESFDLVVLPAPTLAQVEQAGKLAPQSSRPLARVGIGVAVKQGATRPEIGSVAAFRQALLDARAPAYIDPAAGGSSGIYLAGLFERLGIAPQLQAKAVLVPGGLVAQRLLNGEADLAVHQISELLAVPGASLVGPLPAEIQNWTVYAGALAAQSSDAAAGRALLELLGSATARTLLAQKGMEAP